MSEVFFWAGWTGIVFMAIFQLGRIAGALETHNRWMAKIWTEISIIREIANIKRGG